MNDFNKFLEIPSKEISQNTHILEEFIIYIKDKDYGKIKIRAHFHGFIHSISNEYGFDLNFLLDEYENFHNPKILAEKKAKEKAEKEKEKEKKSSKENKIFMDDKEIRENKTDSNNYFIIITSIVIVILFLFWIIFKDDDTTDKKVLLAKKITAKNKETIDSITPKKEKPAIKKKKKTIPKKGKKHTFNINKAKKMYRVKDSMLLIEPFRDNKLWLGITDLNNKKQIGNIVRGLVSYKLKSNTIISTGHGYFNFINTNNDKSIKYRTFDKLFFYYKNGFLYKIKKEDVLALNGGFVW